MAKRKTMPPPEVFKKMSHLVKVEGKSKDQAFAMAMNMHKEGMLTKEGEYKRKKNK